MSIMSNTTAHAVRWLVVLETVLLGGTATVLLIKWMRGQLSFYIHPRYTALIVVAAVILMLMAAVRLRDVFSEHEPRRPNWGYLLLAVPLLFAVLVPAQPLGANVLAGRGLELNSVANTSRPAALSSDPSSWDLLAWAGALPAREAELLGTPLDVIGFVFHNDDTNADSFYIVRYVVTCCAADGAGVGFPVRWAGGGALPEDGWVRVRGSFRSEEFAGVAQPLIVATAVEPVPAPENPYLYP